MNVTLISDVKFASRKGGLREPRKDHTKLFKEVYSMLIDSARENGAASGAIPVEAIPVEKLANRKEYDSFMHAFHSYRTRYSKSDQFKDLTFSVGKVTDAGDEKVSVELEDGTSVDYLPGASVVRN